MISRALERLKQKQDLEASLMQQVMEEVMSGKVETQNLALFLSLLNEKGESIDEVTAAAKVLRAHVTKVVSKARVVLDTCGTGGDKKGTFNISTAVAFVAAGCGVTVAKHGNRSVSSPSGSADILEAVGINIHLSKESLERCLEKTGIAFLFAQDLHPAMKFAMPARKQVGVKTVFNIIGPLANPAQATHQLVGVYSSRLVETVAQVIKNLGTHHALVVHGEDGLDEITLMAETRVAEVQQGAIRQYTVTPEDFNFTRCRLEDLQGGDALTNAEIMLDILQGAHGPRRDIVVLNAAAALYAADYAQSIKEGILRAQKAIDSKAALGKLEQLRAFSKRAYNGKI